jgi:hypothetical protein
VGGHLLKLLRIQNKALRTFGSLPRRTPTCGMHVGLKIPYIHDFVTKLRGQQAKVIQNHEKVNVCNTGQDEAEHEKTQKAQTLWRSGMRPFKCPSCRYIYS